MKHLDQKSVSVYRPTQLIIATDNWHTKLYKHSKIYLILHASPENFATAKSLMYNHTTELYIEPLGKQIYILLTIQLYNCEQHG